MHACSGYVKKELSLRLFVDGIQLITKQKNNMKGSMTDIHDKISLKERAIIETVNDKLKDIALAGLSRHRSFKNFIVNTLGSSAAYCFFPKEPCIHAEKAVKTLLMLF